MRGFHNNVLGGENLRTDYVQIFVRSEEQLGESLRAVMRNFRPGAILWICHPDTPSGLNLNRGPAARRLADCGFEKIKELPLPNRWLASRFREVSKGNSTLN
jgi:hypothetical protein